MARIARAGRGIRAVGGWRHLYVPQGSRSEATPRERASVLALRRPSPEESVISRHRRQTGACASTEGELHVSGHARIGPSRLDLRSLPDRGRHGRIEPNPPTDHSATLQQTPGLLASREPPPSRRERLGLPPWPGRAVGLRRAQGQNPGRPSAGLGVESVACPAARGDREPAAPRGGRRRRAAHSSLARRGCRAAQVAHDTDAGRALSER
jgi:hypothetical protein